MDDSVEPSMTKVKSVLAEGDYDSNSNFQFSEDKKFKQGIKVRDNSIVSNSNSRLTNKEGFLQKQDLLKWKKKRKYDYQ